MRTSTFLTHLHFLLTFLEAGWKSLIQVLPAFLCHENKLQHIVRAAYCNPFNKERYTPTVWALCMVHKNSTWSCLEAQISETVLALTKDSESFGPWPLIWMILPLCCWSPRCLLCGWGEQIALFWALSVECHKMVSGTDFPFAFSLVCLQRLGAEHSAKNPLCVCKSDLSSWFFFFKYEVGL